MPTVTESADACLQRGNAFFQLGRLENAVASYREALRINRDFAPAHNTVANVLHSLGRLTEAVAHYEAAIRLQPEMADLHYNLGATLKELGQLDEAAMRSARRASVGQLGGGALRRSRNRLLFLRMSRCRE